MRGRFRRAQASGQNLQRRRPNRSAQNRGEAPSPSVASLPSTSPRTRGEVKKAKSFSRRIRARVLRPPSQERSHSSRLAPDTKREAKRRKAHCPTNVRATQTSLRSRRNLSATRLRILMRCARLPALHRGTRHRLLPRWLSPRTGFPDVSGSRVFCPLPSSRRLSALRADRSFCRSTGAPEPPECGLAIPPAGTASRSAFQACRPDKRP